MIISVIGGSVVTPEEASLAEQVGRELAKRGATVVCGGLTGAMAAACKGAKEAGGTTIGILPGMDPAEANEYVDIPICTGMGYARNVIVVYSGRAVIAMPGKYGTMSEIGHALATAIPVIGLTNISYSIEGHTNNRMIIASDSVDAVEKALEAAKQRS